jgi:hypothetical protein
MTRLGDRLLSEAEQAVAASLAAVEACERPLGWRLRHPLKTWRLRLEAWRRLARARAAYERFATYVDSEAALRKASGE